MGMAATHTPDHWTVDMLHALPDDGRRYEVVDGELFVTPSPSYDHQDAALALAVRLRGYLAVNPVGHVFMAPLDVIFGPQTLVQPDLVVLPLQNGRRPRSATNAAPPLLAVEILSPSSARADRIVKRQLCQRQGVAEYWIVDLDARVVERWRPDDARPEIVTERVAWQPPGAAQQMTIELEALWREVLDDAEGSPSPTQRTEP